MPFGAFHPDIRQWDDHGGEAAMFAQLMFMSGLLKPSFDRSAFDIHIGRTPREDLTSAQALRQIASRIPGFQVRAVSPHLILSYTDPELMANILRKDGLKEREIKKFLASKEWAWRRSYLLDLKQFGAERNHHFQEIVGADSAATAALFLNQGALVATGDRRDGATLLLMKATGPGWVRVYSTKRGVEPSTLRQLEDDGRLDINKYGCTVYYIP